MRRLIWMIVAAATAAGALGVALTAPMPAVLAPSASAVANATESDRVTAFPAEPVSEPEREAVAPTRYTGEIGPSRPIEIASVDVGTGRYLLRLIIAGRFSALTDDPLDCYLVEQTSGIALEPKLVLTLERSGGWTTARSDVPMSIPAMTVAANCTTASTTFGELELLRATLVAEQLG